VVVVGCGAVVVVVGRPVVVVLLPRTVVVALVGPVAEVAPDDPPETTVLGVTAGVTAREDEAAWGTRTVTVVVSFWTT